MPSMLRVIFFVITVLPSAVGGTTFFWCSSGNVLTFRHCSKRKCLGVAAVSQLDRVIQNIAFSAERGFVLQRGLWKRLLLATVKPLSNVGVTGLCMKK